MQTQSRRKAEIHRLSGRRLALRPRRACSRFVALRGEPAARRGRAGDAPGARAPRPAFTVGKPVPLANGATSRAGRRCGGPSSPARARRPARRRSPGSQADARADDEHRRRARPRDDADGRVWVRGPAPGAAQRHDRLGAARRSAATARCARGSWSTGAPARRRCCATAGGCSRADRRRHRGAPTPRGRVLRPQPPDALPQRVLRPRRARHERPLGDADRLAGRRLRRHPRHRPARPAPGPRLHGCIRMRNADVLRLARLIPIGTPVSIH